METEEMTPSGEGRGRFRRLLDFLNNIHNDNDPSPYQKTFAPQFTWMEALLILYMVIMYMVVWVVIITIIIDKYNDSGPSADVYLYIIFFIAPNIIAGLKSLHYHFRQITDQQSEPNWFLHFLFLPCSPLLRYFQALNFGRKEKGTWEGSLRFITEMIRVVTLRLIDTLLGCAPIVVLLLREDIWQRSEDWHVLIAEVNMDCSKTCPDINISNMAWHVSRILILTSQVAMNLSLYSLAMKRYHHLESPQLYEHLRSRKVKSGKVNIFGSAVIFGAHFSFVTSRLLGYSMVLTVAPWYLVLILFLRWFTNVFWHFLTTIYNIPSFFVRLFSSFTVGGIWLLGFTNELRGAQLARYIIFYFIALAESLFCCTIWFLIISESDDYFTKKAVWAVVVTLSASGVLFALYYSACHPSHLKVKSRAARCCSSERATEIEEADHECTQCGSDSNAIANHS